MFGSPVGLRIGLPGSAAEVIEEKEPGGDDQHCNGDKMGGAGIGGHLISRECRLADWQHSRHGARTRAPRLPD